MIPSNIALSCSSKDRILSNQLAQHLMDEGYSISIYYSSDTQPSNLRSKFDKANLIIICFSWNYSEDLFCMETIQWIGRSSINQEESWLQRITVEE